jgi:hypothetical protein
VAARKLLEQAHRGVAGAHDHHRRTLLAPPAVERPFLEGAERHAAHRHEGDEEERIEDVFAVIEARVEARHAQGGGNAHRSGEHREDDSLDVGQARVAPDALVDAE